MIHPDILSTVGNTPVVRINKVAPAHVEMYVKCEAFNPLSSVKDRLDYWVSGYGTGGTITGAGDVLRAARPGIKIIAAEPEKAALLGGDEWQPHTIQGWTPDFMPSVLDRKVIDEVVRVDDVEAREAAIDLAQKEVIFCGISSGATLCAALKVAEQADKGSVLLAMLPDTGEDICPRSCLKTSPRNRIRWVSVLCSAP